VRQQIAVHLADLCQHQVDRVVGDRLQPGSARFLHGRKFAALQERRRPFEVGFAAEEALHERRHLFRPLEDVREIIQVEPLEGAFA